MKIINITNLIQHFVQRLDWNFCVDRSSINDRLRLEKLILKLCDVIDDLPSNSILNEAGLLVSVKIRD